MMNRELYKALNRPKGHYAIRDGRLEEFDEYSQIPASAFMPIHNEAGINRRIAGIPTVTADLRNEIIVNSAQFMEAIYRWKTRHTEQIGDVQLSPTQEYCLKYEHLGSVYNVKEDRPYRMDEIGSLQQFMGYTITIKSKE